LNLLVPDTTEVVAAVDIGGTRIKASLVDRSFAVLARTTTETPRDIAEDIGAVVAARVRELMAAVPDDQSVSLVGCGVVVPGLVDEARGLGIRSVNLGWQDLPIRDRVRAHLDVPVVVGHDVRAGLVAETRLGAGVGHRHVLFMPLGTGIAGALLLDGTVVGGDGFAGELGHVVVDPAGPACPCGQQGCLEVLASASALERSYEAASGTRVPAETVAERAAAGEQLATAAWSGVVSALGRALATVVTLTGVELVLVGGGLAQSGELLLAPLRQDLADRLTFQRLPDVQRAALGDRAGSLGAACLIWDAL
jgi:glucokinase